MKTIAVWLTHPDVDCWRFKERHKKRIETAVPGINIIVCNDSREFKTALAEAEIAIFWVFKQEWFVFAPKLKHLITPAAGHDYFSITPPRGVSLSYGRFHGEIIAETVIGMILANARGIGRSIQLQASDPWPREVVSGKMCRLMGKHLVILGFGKIGSEIGRMAKVFGMRITGIKRSPLAPPDYFTQGDSIVLLREFHAILPKTDHLVIALPRSSETDDIIGRKELDLLPSHSGIYNIGRGNAIDETALVEALTHHSIEAAYLDVCKTEPLEENSPLRKCPNCYIMPHTSAATPEYLDLFVEEFLNSGIF